MKTDSQDLIKKFNKELAKDPGKRNFNLSSQNPEYKISVDTLIFKEFVKNENVYTYNEREFIGIYASYMVK